jgi:hypothetical protein
MAETAEFWVFRPIADEVESTGTTGAERTRYGVSEDGVTPVRKGFSREEVKAMIASGEWCRGRRR